MPGFCPRSFVFTLNNPTKEHMDSIASRSESLFSYIVYGMEVGTNGTPHIQGYAECNTRHRFGKVCDVFHGHAHIAPRKGTPKEAAGYCKKGDCEHHIKSNQRCEYCQDYDGHWDFFFPRTVQHPETWQVPFEFGTISGQGKRTDISPATDMILENVPLRDVARSCPDVYVKYHRGFRDLRSQVLPPRSLSEPPKVYVLWGPTMTGKTRDALIHFWPDEPYYVWRPSNGNWWDGYDGEKKIILEEFRAQMPWADLLALLDRNEYRAPYKGGFIQIQADKFVITSPLEPPFRYREDYFDKLKQLDRRITKVFEYPQLFPPVYES